MPIYAAATMGDDAPSYDRVVRYQIPPGMAGTRATLELIEIEVQKGKRSVEVSELSEEILTRFQARPHDELSQIEAVRRALREGLFYAHDPRGVETLRDARKMAGKVLAYFRGEGPRPVADCDDFTILGRALLEFLGYRTKSRAVGTVRPNGYNHVFPMVMLKSGRWIGLEATTPRYPPMGFIPRSTQVDPMDFPAIHGLSKDEPWYKKPLTSVEESSLKIIAPTMEQTFRPAVQQLTIEISYLKWTLLALAAAALGAGYYFVRKAHARRAA